MAQTAARVVLRVMCVCRVFRIHKTAAVSNPMAACVGGMHLRGIHHFGLVVYLRAFLTTKVYTLDAGASAVGCAVRRRR